jgi:hypothetical protein
MTQDVTEQKIRWWRLDVQAPRFPSGSCDTRNFGGQWSVLQPSLIHIS